MNKSIDIQMKEYSIKKTDMTKEVILDVLKYNGFKIMTTHKEYKQVEIKGNKGGLFYVDIPTKLNDLPEFLNDYKGTNLNVKIDSLRDYK